MDSEATANILTEIGQVWISTSPEGVCRVHLRAGSGRSVRQSPLDQAGSPPKSPKTPLRTLLDRAAGEMQRYAAGELRRFTVPLDLQGTPFQRAVWKALQEIPYGETRTYGEIAARIGKPGAARAVGMACRENPVGILVPCHRVIGAGGGLTGYAGGIELKEKLLDLERRGKEIFDGRPVKRGYGPA